MKTIFGCPATHCKVLLLIIAVTHTASGHDDDACTEDDKALVLDLKMTMNATLGCRANFAHIEYSPPCRASHCMNVVEELEPSFPSCVSDGLNYKLVLTEALAECRERKVTRRMRRHDHSAEDHTASTHEPIYPAVSPMPHSDAAVESVSTSSVPTNSLWVFIAMTALMVVFVITFVWRRSRVRSPNDLEELGSPTAASEFPSSCRQVKEGSANSVLDTYFSTHSPVTSTTRLAHDGSNRGNVLVAARIQRTQVVVRQQICRGGFGAVYGGTYNNQDVAVKMLLPEARGNAQRVEDFLAEATLLASLRHPRIVQFIGVAWDSVSDLCVVMELMEGGDLRTLLAGFQQNPGVSTGFDKQKLKIALQVARALVYLHSLEPAVIHRDLKSRNILLNRELDAKLGDFGVSRQRIDITMTSDVGTPFWTAPEVMLGHRYDTKADMFSFGVVLSELDTHTLPHANAREIDPAAGANQTLPQTAILQLVVMGKLSVELSPGCQESVAALGRACVAADPSGRPSAAEALYRLQVVFEQHS